MSQNQEQLVLYQKMRSDMIKYAFHWIRPYLHTQQRITSHEKFQWFIRDYEAIIYATFINAYNRFRKQKILRFEQILYTMIRNDVVKEARKEASHHKKMQHYLSKNQNKNEILHSHVNDINQEIEINEQIMMIEKFLVGYPDIVKTIIRMKITGDSNFEIARKLRVNYTYINNTINRFITRFRKVNNS